MVCSSCGFFLGLYVTESRIGFDSSCDEIRLRLDKLLPEVVGSYPRHLNPPIVHLVQIGCSLSHFFFLSDTNMSCQL